MDQGTEIHANQPEMGIGLGFFTVCVTVIFSFSFKCIFINYLIIPIVLNLNLSNFK